ncbi:LLM class F420-dependent oxidoreductase [Rhizorhabdus argentea]|uniref:LLM class F420-dependent oxidoreductase n=1 Tax=Rhizorhabdus argentea TaxID=1387174 RepID=UPI0030EDD79A
MKIGISIPNNWGVPDAPSLIDLAVQAEDRGFASVWTSEHLINLDYVRARIGDGAYYHPLAMLSAIAARTNRIQLGTSVLVLPFHSPFDVAKYIATLDQISRGRVILGVGVGNVREEFDVLGIPWARRGAITDESLDVIRALWTQEDARHEGERWQFSGIRTSPKPYRGRRVPIWIGGMSRAASKRAVRVGDGWHPTGITPAQLREQADAIRELARANGRDPDSVEICMRFNVALDDAEITEVELRSTVKGGDMARAADIAGQFRDAGATHFIFALNSHDAAVLSRTVDQFAEELLPNFADDGGCAGFARGRSVTG